MPSSKSQPPHAGLSWLMLSAGSQVACASQYASATRQIAPLSVGFSNCMSSNEPSGGFQQAKQCIAGCCCACSKLHALLLVQQCMVLLGHPQQLVDSADDTTASTCSHLVLHTLSD
jgi:hypothetical protein